VLTLAQATSRSGDIWVAAKPYTTNGRAVKLYPDLQSYSVTQGLKHLLNKLVIDPVKGLGATASYDAVFADYGTSSAAASKKGPSKSSSAAGSTGSVSTGGASSSSATAGSASAHTGGGAAKPGVLFSYPAKTNNALLKQLMKEAKEIKCNRFPAAATFLLRNIVETILKHIIDDQGANKSGKTLDLEGCLNLCANQNVTLPSTDKKILSEFRKDHFRSSTWGPTEA
jgi:hypothetical protein